MRLDMNIPSCTCFWLRISPNIALTVADRGYGAQVSGCQRNIDGLQWVTIAQSPLRMVQKGTIWIIMITCPRPKFLR